MGQSVRGGVYADAGRRAGIAALGLALLASLAAAEEGPARQCLNDAEVCIETVPSGAVIRFVASNRTLVPYSLRIAPRQLSNLKPLGSPPFRAVLEPGEERVVGSLGAIAPDRSSSYRFEWAAAPGSMLARHDDGWQYRMPFGGDANRILGQGVGGSYSHQGRGRYAFDFSMPWGTPVLAARAGVVIAVRDGSVASGTRRTFYDKANAVEVLHADGTIATYAHLADGARVEPGQRVEAGDRIGVSGDTGFSTGPHLHFMVWRRTADLQWTTVPILFHDGSAAGFVPTQGVAYAPACTGGGCAPDATAAASERRPATPAPAAATASRATRRSDGACVCPNGATIHVDLPCNRVCAR